MSDPKPLDPTSTHSAFCQMMERRAAHSPYPKDDYVVVVSHESSPRRGFELAGCGLRFSGNGRPRCRMSGFRVPEIPEGDSPSVPNPYSLHLLP